MALLLTQVVVGVGLVGVTSSALEAQPPGAHSWIPPPADSPFLLEWLRDTSRPKLAYSTWVGWCEISISFYLYIIEFIVSLNCIESEPETPKYHRYEDGGLNESALLNQVH